MTDRIKIRIISCSKKGAWYEDRIGKEHYVRHYNKLYYYEIATAIKGEFRILKADCKKIEEEGIRPFG